MLKCKIGQDNVITVMNTSLRQKEQKLHILSKVTCDFSYFLWINSWSHNRHLNWEVEI